MKRCFRNLLLVDTLYLYLSTALMFYFAQAKAAEATFGSKCCLIKLLTHPNNRRLRKYRMFEQLVNEALCLSMAPVEALGEIANAGDELAAFDSALLVVLAGGRNINNVELGLEMGELLAGFAEQRIGPDSSLKGRVAAIHLWPSTSREETQISATHACVLLASGGCTGWNKLEFLTGKRVCLVFSMPEPSWQSGGREFDPHQLHHLESIT
jgi:hypothetical protein